MWGGRAGVGGSEERKKSARGREAACKGGEERWGREIRAIKVNMWLLQFLTGSWWRRHRERESARAGGGVDRYTRAHSEIEVYLQTRWERQAGSAVCWGSPLTWKDVRELPAAGQGPRHVPAPEPGHAPPGPESQPAELLGARPPAVPGLRLLPPPPPRHRQRATPGPASPAGGRWLEPGIPASSARAGRLVLASLRASRGLLRDRCGGHHPRIRAHGVPRPAACADPRLPERLRGATVPRLPAEEDPVRVDPHLRAAQQPQ